MIETLTKFRYEVCRLFCSSIAAFGADIESCTDVIRIGGQNQCIGTVDYLRLTLNNLIELLLDLDWGRHFRAIAAEGSEVGLQCFDGTCSGLDRRLFTLSFTYEYSKYTWNVIFNFVMLWREFC